MKKNCIICKKPIKSCKCPDQFTVRMIAVVTGYPRRRVQEWVSKNKEGSHSNLYAEKLDDGVTTPYIISRDALTAFLANYEKEKRKEKKCKTGAI